MDTQFGAMWRRVSDLVHSGFWVCFRSNSWIGLFEWWPSTDTYTNYGTENSFCPKWSISSVSVSWEERGERLKGGLGVCSDVDTIRVCYAERPTSQSSSMITSKRKRLWRQAVKICFLHRLVWWSLRDMLKSLDIWEELKVEPLLLIKSMHLRWFGHLAKMPWGHLHGEVFQAYTCPYTDPMPNAGQDGEVTHPVWHRNALVSSRSCGSGQTVVWSGLPYCDWTHICRCNWD